MMKSLQVETAHVCYARIRCGTLDVLSHFWASVFIRVSNTSCDNKQSQNFSGVTQNFLSYSTKSKECVGGGELWPYHVEASQSLAN